MDFSSKNLKYSMKMKQNINNLNYIEFANLCRTCSNYIEDSYNFDMEAGTFYKHSLEDICILEDHQTLDTKYLRIIDLLENFIGFEISTDDMLPKQICNVCKNDLIKAYSFRLQCLKSYNSLIIIQNNKKLVIDQVQNKLENYAFNVEHKPHLNLNSNNLDELAEDYNFEKIEFDEIDQCNSDNFISSAMDIQNSPSFENQCDENILYVQNNIVDDLKFFNEQEIISDDCNEEKNILKNLNCPYCNIIYPENLIKQHLKEVHAKTDLYMCKICNKTFRQSSSIKRHEKYVHLLSNESGGKYKLCVICRSYFKNKVEYKQHVSEHFSIAIDCNQRKNITNNQKNENGNKNQILKQCDCNEETCDHLSLSTPRQNNKIILKPKTYECLTLECQKYSKKIVLMSSHAQTI